MRAINYIAVHCSATPPTATVSSIQKYWKEKLKWKSPGYHVIVKPNGDAVELLPIDQASNGVKGYNSQTINISYIGGIDAKGKPTDTRTPEQKATILRYLTTWKKMFPKAIIQGHRDFPNVQKACPSFDAKNEYKNV
ncbi:N-acetylmuramoyl-L-alanine amidase [Chryseobacterium sp. TY4]